MNRLLQLRGDVARRECVDDISESETYNYTIYELVNANVFRTYRLPDRPYVCQWVDKVLCDSKSAEIVLITPSIGLFNATTLKT